MITNELATYFDNYQNIILTASDFLNKGLSDQSESFYNTYETMLEFDQSLNYCESIDAIINYSKTFFLENDILKSFEIFLKTDNQEFLCESHNIYPLIYSDYEYFLKISLLDNFNKEEESFFISYIISSLERQMGETCNDKAFLGLYEKAISKLNIPFALLSPSGEVIFHNSSFSNLKLIPKKCLSLSNEDKIEFEDVLYTIYQSVINHNGNENLCYVFLKSQDDLDKTNGKSNFKEISSKELGIISSSIAHELNNPIAGILAGIELIKLDTHINENTGKLIEDIQNSALRIKELIRIFLGFSRASLEQESRVPPYEAFLHARDLIRFRMVESNTCLDIKKVQTGESFETGMYLAIASMSFYLVINEILTSFSHYKLVANRENENLNHDCLFFEYKKRIEIHFCDEIEIRKVLESQKLMEYLNKLSDLKMKITPGKVIFSKCSG